MKKLIWEFDMLVYRLFCWRWFPRLKSDPNLAYMFAEVSAAWSKANPPHSRDAMDELLEAERVRIREGQPCLDKSHWISN